MSLDEPHLRVVEDFEDDFRIEDLAFKRLAALDDPQIRIARLSSMFESHPVAFVALVERVVSSLNVPHGRATYLDLVRLLSGARKVRDTQWEQAYNYCVRQNHSFLRFVLLKMKGVRVPDMSFSTIDIDDMTLGERKSKARIGDEQALNKLTEDIDPRVVEQLLLHPRMTESKVLKIATKRPTHPDSLVAIIHSLRWGSLPHVHEAVVGNPWASDGLRVALVPLLGRKAIRSLRKGSASLPAIRAAMDYMDGDREALNNLV